MIDRIWEIASLPPKVSGSALTACLRLDTGSSARGQAGLLVWFKSQAVSSRMILKSNHPELPRWSNQLQLSTRTRAALRHPTMEDLWVSRSVFDPDESSTWHATELGLLRCLLCSLPCSFESTTVCGAFAFSSKSWTEPASRSYISECFHARTYRGCGFSEFQFSCPMHRAAQGFRR